MTIEDVAGIRLELEDIIVGTCYDCDNPITGLDACCRDESRHGTFLYHASCIGCYQSEGIRQSAAGCGICAREQKQEGS